jgi:hypothetical protein
MCSLWYVECLARAGRSGAGGVEAGEHLRVHKK